MMAFAVERIGAQGSLHELPVPRISADDVLVQVAAAGVNPIDWMIRDGLVPTDRRLPFVLGQDFAGKVVAVGSDVRRYAVGDRIFGIARSYGSYAQYTLVPEMSAAEPTSKIPGDVDDADAASLPTAGLTALASLDLLGVSRGTLLLIAGAAGGVGSFASQIAHARGATVVGTAHSSNLDFVRDRGVDEPIAYDSENELGAIRALHPTGVDALLDLVHDATGMKYFGELVRRGGKAASTIGSADVAWFKSRGIDAYNIVLNQTPQSSDASLRALATMADDGKLDATITAEEELSHADRALALSKSGRAKGKIVLTIG